MKRIVLFRFHTDAALCRNRLQLLKKYNPRVDLYGLYGGPEHKFEKYKKNLDPHFKDIYCIRDRSGYWKWKNGDLAIRQWYIDFGKNISFDMLHFIEWDILLFDSLENIYSHIPATGSGFTSLIELNKVKDQWPWAAHEDHQKELHNLLTHVKEKYNYTDEPFASEGPGLCVSKNFLDHFAQHEIPDMCNDEVRMPLYSQIFNFTPCDTLISGGWLDKENEKFFNCRKKSISWRIIKKELKRPGGRKVFHPYRNIVIINRSDILRRIPKTVFETVFNIKMNIIHVRNFLAEFLKIHYPSLYETVRSMKKIFLH